MDTFVKPSNSLEEPEGHFKWLSEYLPLLETDAKALNKTFDDFLNHRINRKTMRFGHEVAGLEDSEYSTLYTVANSLSLVAAFTFLRNLKEAKRELNWIKSKQILYYLSGEIRLVENKYEAVANYFIAIMNWTIWSLDENSKKSSSSRKRRNRNKKLKLRTILSTIKSSESLATMLFFKGSFASFLGLKHDTIVEIFNECVKLEPNIHFWYAVSYKSLREQRKSGCGWATISFPTGPEQAMAKKAFALCPNDIHSHTNYAIFLWENLKSQANNHWRQNWEMVKECLEQFELLLIRLKMEPFHNSNFKRKIEQTIKVNFAEFLLFGKDNCLNRKRGKDILESCLDPISPDRYVLHKLAKLYNLGALAKLYVDYEKAKEYYKMALRSEPGNVHCTLEYLRFLSNDGENEKAEIHRILEQAEENCHSERDLDKFRIQRGCFTWRFNLNGAEDCQKEACQMWLDVLTNCKNWPERLKDISETIENHRSFWNTSGIDKAAVIDKLGEIQSSLSVKREAVSKLMDELAMKFYRPPARRTK